MDRAKKTVRYTNMTTGETAEKHSFVDLQFNEDGFLFWARKPYVKTFLGRSLPDCFTWSERGRIHELKQYILKENQFLVFKSGNTIKPLTPNEMANILAMSRRQILSLIKKMKSHSIIKEISFDGLIYFVFNPIYGFNQKRLNINVYMFFQQELSEVLPKWAIEKFSEFAVELRPNFKVLK